MLRNNKMNFEIMLSITVPVFNHEKYVITALDSIKMQKTKYSFEVLIGEDCSTDNTLKILEENNVNHISTPFNLRYAGGVQTGFKYAVTKGYKYVAQFDGDGQHDAKYLKKLVNEIEKNGVDVAIGSRFVDEKKPFTMRMLGSRFISTAIKLTTWKKITDPTSGMRAYNKKAIEMFCTNASLTPEPDTVVYMIKRGLNVKEVQVQMREREFGESYLNAFKSVKYMANMMMSILFIRSFTGKEK